MPTITIDKKDLFKLMGKTIPDETLKDRISMLGTDLEKVTKDEVEVEIFPNRPDMLSTEGFARALGSFIGVKKSREYKVNKSSYKSKKDAKVKKVRPFAVNAVVKGIKLDNNTIKSLMQVQEKLHASHGRNRKKVSIGVYDLNKFEFPLTYTTKPKDFKFIPLEFKKELTISQILEKHPKGRDYAFTLEKFKECPIWLDKNKQVLALVPIINSEETKVDEKTKDLFIDVTGTSLEACEQALNIVTTSLADRGGKIYEVKVDNVSYPNLEQKKLKLNKSYVEERLGLFLNETQIKKLLEKMGITYSNGNASIPAYRTDILSEIDLIEEIAIAYGYENFVPEIPNVSTIAKESEFEVFRNKICNILANLGLIETNTYNLTNKNSQEKLMNIKNLKLAEIANALNKDYDVLRTWMIPSLLEVLKNNKHYDYPQKIFEAGSVFVGEKEKTRLGVLLAYPKVTFTDIKQILDVIFNSLDLTYEIKEAEHGSFIPGRVGRVYCKGKGIAFIGEIYPQVLENFSLETPIAALELNLTDLFELTLQKTTNS
jgi:phenylalanyl-tRNA synthetase beta chain